MKISDVMTSEVEVIRPDATLDEAAEKMRSLDVGPLPVCDGDRLVGMITDRDITIRATAAGMDPKTTRISDVMTSDIAYCFADQEIEEAALQMQEKQLRRLAVVDRNKRLAGIISLGDLTVRAADRELSGEVLQEVSEPATPQRRAA
ncbi:MAG: CBS domain-containing protein [Actinomycetota bacterium]